MNGQLIPALMNVVPRLDHLKFNQLRCYTCIQFGRSFEKKQSLKRHITDKHETKISCDFCGYKVGASRRSLMDRHLLLKHCFPVAVSQRQETTMEMAPTLPELETPSTDAITLEDQPMKDTDYINTCTPMPSTPGFVSPAPPSSPEPGKTLPLYTADLDLQSRDAPVPSPLQTTPPLRVWKGQTHLTHNISFWVPRVPRTTLLIHEARDRAIPAGPRHYSVQFIPMTLFALKKVESASIEGREYSVSSYWIEEPQASLSMEVSTQTSTSS